MKVRVSTDSNINGSDGLSRRITEVVEDALRRFSDRVTRVEVFLSDQSSRAKSGGDDKRCTMEARLAGLAPIAVTEDNASLEQAFLGAATKLQQTLERTLERRDDPKRRTSFGGDQTR